MSGTHQTPNNPSHSTFRRGYALNQTKQLLLRGPQGGENVLVQPPPTVHPEELIPELIAAHDLQALFIAPTDNQLNRMKSRCRSLNISTRGISSPYHECPSYDGQHGDAVEAQVENTLEQGVPLGRLHKTRDLPCCPNCPFTKWKRPEFAEQVILVNPRHAYISGLLEERVVFTCALRGDAYITKIENPPQAFDSYLKKNTQFSGYRDFMLNRDSKRAPSIRDYKHETLDPSMDDEKFGYAIDKDGHHLAPQAVFGLIYTEKLDNGWETSHYYEKDEYGNCFRTDSRKHGPNTFKIVGLGYGRNRVVRQPGETPEDDTIYVLEVPDFTNAKSVIAFDVAPTPWMWKLYYGTNFDHRRVYSDDDTAEFLRREMNTDVIQTTASRKPYDGANVTPGRDASIAMWATAEFGKHPFIVSTKNALGRYQSNQRTLLNDDAKAGVQYRRGGPVITENAPLVILNGSPRPRNERLQLWGALAGKSVRNPDQHQSIKGLNLNQAFERNGQEIRRQFCESRVAKWATRFTSKDAIIILNTTAVPEWLQDNQFVKHASPIRVLPENANAKRKIARFLRQQAQEGQRVTIGKIESETGITRQTIYTVRDDFEDEGWVTAYPSKNPTEYEWNQ
jgi:hypothetical protein